MATEKARLHAWEERWARPAGLASLAAIALMVASILVAGQIGGSDGDAELLRNVDDHSSARLISAFLQAAGVALLALPLYVLFRAAAGRSEAVRRQLVGVVIAGPLFLAVAFALTGVVTVQAADDFVSDHLPRLLADGVALDSDRADDAASDAITDASLRPLSIGFGIGGQIGFVVGMFYTALQAMRTGLLSRFWGSLGMALGAVSFLFFQFAVLWFFYVGLLLAGWIPGGRPPAWESGEAEPWPTPGERAAGTLGGGAEAPDDRDAAERKRPE